MGEPLSSNIQQNTEYRIQNTKHITQNTATNVHKITNVTVMALGFAPIKFIRSRPLKLFTVPKLSGSSMSRGIKWFYSRVACRWCRVRRKLAENEDQVMSEFTMR